MLQTHSAYASHRVVSDADEPGGATDTSSSSTTHAAAAWMLAICLRYGLNRLKAVGMLRSDTSCSNAQHSVHSCRLANAACQDESG